MSGDHLKEVDKVANILAAAKMLWYEVLHSPLVAKYWNRSDLLTKKRRGKKSQCLKPSICSGRFVDGAHKYDYLQSEWKLKKQIEEEFRVDVKNFFRLSRTHLVNLVTLGGEVCPLGMK